MLNWSQSAMKIIHTFRSPLRLLAVLIGFMAFGSGGYAQFVGVSHEVVATTPVGTTYRLYANFGNAGDRLGSVFGVSTPDGVNHLNWHMTAGSPSAP
jgi:hypothetical protein